MLNVERPLIKPENRAQAKLSTACGAATWHLSSYGRKNREPINLGQGFLLMYRL